MIRINGRFVTALLLSVTLCPAGRTWGAVIQTSYDTLLPGGANAGGIRIGSQRYTDFTFRNDGPFALNPADVTVRFSNDDPFFIRETVQFVLGVDATAGQAGSIHIGYRAEDESSSYYSRYGLRFNAQVPSQGVGVGSAAIVNSVSTVDGSDVEPGAPVSSTATLDIFNDGPGRLEDSNSDFLSVNPTRVLRTDHRITLEASAAGRLDISFVNNYLTVPEPSAALLAAPAVMFLLARRRN
jgi:hypothetical protein